ncbi:MAG: DUF115 domain-containing protein [Spirochaetaceae bacterium]|jgi:hypothetical protein|nr:DUF115 domain-containing protein [Spirochaetaceae bacterium]
MKEELFTGNSGILSVKIGEKTLHSRYDPLSEAENYIRSLALSGEIRFFLLIEPGLGYIIPVLREFFPKSRILAVHVSPFLAKKQAETASGAIVWSPDSGLELTAFLEREVPDIEAREARIVEWRPAAAIYGGEYLRLLRKTAEFVKRIDANARTARGFGKRWFRNFFRNLRLIREIADFTDLRGHGIPWIITGAGPSLEENTEAIREMLADGGFLLAASSSAAALRDRNIPVDLVISTDGGGWALFHLYETLRSRERPPLAFSFSAALPSQCRAFPLLPLSDGSPWQELVLEGLGIPHISLPQRGTVAASALDLALFLTDGKIVFTGMDLSQRDIRTHARPYAFDRFQEGTSSRFSPRYSQEFFRALAINAMGSQKIYAEWFREELAHYPRRIFSLGNNNAVFDNIRVENSGKIGLTGNGKPGKAGRRLSFRTFPWAGKSADPVRDGVEILLAALERGETAERIFTALGPLLLPDRQREYNDESGRLLAEQIKLLGGGGHHG